MKRFYLRQGALHEHPEGKWVLHKDVDRVLRWLDKTADGVPIVTEGPVFTPDGRVAYIEPFSSTPVAVVKHDTYPDEDEYFEACNCFSTLEAAEAAGGE